jgi:hypothetical protein
VLELAEDLRRKVLMVEPDEFYWQDSHYDHDSAGGRELLFLIANHEWVRATSETIDISRSDVIETTIKIDIDLSQITHEAFRQRHGRHWLPVTVLPPLSGERRLEPDPFATVTDASGNLLPLMTAEDLGHQVSAALAEIIVNMAVAHVPVSWKVPPDAGEDQRHGQPSRAGTRDQRVLLAAAIYRMLRSGLDRNTAPGEQEPVLATPRIREARESLLRLFTPYILDLAVKAGGNEPSAQFVPELAERAVRVLQALMQSIIVVVPMDYDTAPTVLTVRVPTRIIQSTSAAAKWRKPGTWLIRPSAHLDIDVLLPTADADRQIQVQLADGVSFEGSWDKPESAKRFLPRLDIAVTKPPSLEDLSTSMDQILHDRVRSWPTGLVQSLVDLAWVKATVAGDTLRHYEVKRERDDLASGDPQSGASSRVPMLKPLTQELEKLAGAPIEPTALSMGLPDLRGIWQNTAMDAVSLTRQGSVDSLGPRTVVARVEMIEDVAQRATPESAKVSVDVKLDDRDYFSIARTSTLMTLILMMGVLAFLAGWHLVSHKAAPAPEVLAIVLTLFATIQASRIERPDRSTLRGQLSAIANWLVAASMLPAITLALALAFQPGGWVAVYWAAGCSAAQVALLVLMRHGPLTPAGSPRNEGSDEFRIGQRRKFETEKLNYRHFEALRSDYWRNTTAEALMVGRMAYGYVVWQGPHDRTAAGSRSPQLQALLSPHQGSVTSDESNSLLALLHSGTEHQAITFAVFREKPDENWATGENVRQVNDLNLDPDRLAPMDNVNSTVDIFIGVCPDEMPTIIQHPLIAVIEAAKNKLIVLEAQLPIPAPVADQDDMQWARLRVALRDTKDIGRLTEFLEAVRQQIGPAESRGHTIAVQAVPTVRPRVITQAPARQSHAASEESDWSQVVGGSEVHLISGMQAEQANARTWRMLAICADARSNIENDILQQLPIDRSRFQLAHMNYALLHGTAVLVALAHDTRSDRTGNARDDDHQPPQQPARAGSPGPEHERAAADQVSILVDETVTREQLGPMVQCPLLRIRFRWQDRPGAFLNVLSSMDDFLRKPPLGLGSSVSYARLQVASGRVAHGYLTIRMHPPARLQGDWNSIGTGQLGRHIGALATLQAAPAQTSGFRGDGRLPAENPVIRVDLITKMS